MQTPIIFGKTGYNTLGTIHCMAEKKCPFFLLLVTNSKFDPILRSKYVKKFKLVETDEQGVQFLLDNKELFKGKVIIPTSDKAESVMDLCFKDLWGYYLFPNASKKGRVNWLMDKENQVQIAKTAGLNTPITLSYKKGGVLSESIPFPSLVKPLKSITGRKGILTACYSKEELYNIIEQNKETEEFLIQQYINKSHDLLLLGCRFPNGKTWIPGVFKKERWHMYGGDGSFGLISTEVEKFFSQIKEVERMLDIMNYYGPFSIEFGVEDGLAYFYEINLRNDGTSHYFHKAGIYIPYVYYLFNIGKSHLISLDIKPTSYTFIDEFGDFVNWRTSGLSIVNWYKDLKNASVYKYFVMHDLKPFLLMAPRRIASSIYSMIKIGNK